MQYLVVVAEIMLRMALCDESSVVMLHLLMMRLVTVCANHCWLVLLLWIICWSLLLERIMLCRTCSLSVGYGEAAVAGLARWSLRKKLCYVLG